MKAQNKNEAKQKDEKKGDKNSPKKTPDNKKAGTSSKKK